MRTYKTGATRDDNTEKPDYKGFTSPSALKAFGAYMHQHRKQADGTLRASDNWKKGIPIDDYVESWYRHTVDFLDAYEAGDTAKCRELACATWFNVQGFLHETLKTDSPAMPDVYCNCGCGLTERKLAELNVQHIGCGVPFKTPVSVAPCIHNCNIDLCRICQYDRRFR